MRLYKNIEVWKTHPLQVKKWHRHGWNCPHCNIWITNKKYPFLPVPAGHPGAWLLECSHSLSCHQLFLLCPRCAALCCQRSPPAAELVVGALHTTAPCGGRGGALGRRAVLSRTTNVCLFTCYWNLYLKLTYMENILRVAPMLSRMSVSLLSSI